MGCTSEYALNSKTEIRNIVWEKLKEQNCYHQLFVLIDKYKTETSTYIRYKEAYKEVVELLSANKQCVRLDKLIEMAELSEKTSEYSENLASFTLENILSKPNCIHPEDYDGLEQIIEKLIKRKSEEKISDEWCATIEQKVSKLQKSRPTKKSTLPYFAVKEQTESQPKTTEHQIPVQAQMTRVNQIKQQQAEETNQKLTDPKVSADEVLRILSTIPENTPQKIDLSSRGVAAWYLKELCKQLPRNVFKSLNLSSNGLTDEEFNQFLDILENQGSTSLLRELDISDTSLSGGTILRCKEICSRQNIDLKENLSANLPPTIKVK